jgi:hypothetical protein
METEALSLIRLNEAAPVICLINSSLICMILPPIYPVG